MIDRDRGTEHRRRWCRSEHSAFFFNPRSLSPGQAGRQADRQTDRHKDRRTDGRVDGRGVEHAWHAVAVALLYSAMLSCSAVLYVSLQKGTAHTRSACVSAARLPGCWLAGGQQWAHSNTRTRVRPKRPMVSLFGGVHCESLPCRTLSPSGNYGLVPSSFGCVIDEASPPSDVIRPPPPIRTQPEPQPVPFAARPWNSGATPGPDGA